MAIINTKIPTPYALQGGASIPAAPISLCKASSVPPRACFVEINWSKYPTGNVSIDLLGITAGQRIDIIKSVYIDNLGINIPVTVFFPDTQHEVVCGANATLSEDVLTGNLQAQIILGNTSISLSSLTSAVTRVWFLNVNQMPFDNPAVVTAVAEYEASNLPGTPQVYIPKPAGEQHAEFQMDLHTGQTTDIINGGTVTGNIFQNYNMPSNANSYVVFTDVYANVQAICRQGVISGSTITGAVCNVTLKQASGKHWFDWYYWLTTGKLLDKTLQDSHGLFTQVSPWNTTFQLGVVGVGGSTTWGFFNVQLNFTYVSQV